MKSYLIVDGYNIINSWASLKSIAKENMEQARDKLIEILGDFCAYKGVEGILVFDAHLVKGSKQKEENIDGIQVVYTKEHQTADSYIEKMVYSLSRLHFVQVATSDWAEQQTILSSGGVRISARELENEVDDIKKKMSERYEDKENSKGDLLEILEPHLIEKLERWRKKED